MCWLCPMPTHDKNLCPYWYLLRSIRLTVLSQFALVPEFILVLVTRLKVAFFRQEWTFHHIRWTRTDNLNTQISLKAKMLPRGRNSISLLRGCNLPGTSATFLLLASFAFLIVKYVPVSEMLENIQSLIIFFKS